MQIRPFDDMPPFSNRPWRDLVRWMLRRGGFKGVPEGSSVQAILCMPCSDAHFARWVRRRPQLFAGQRLSEVIRVDVKGHGAKGHTALKRSVTVRDKTFELPSIGYGEVRHFHKVAVPVGREEEYFAVRGAVPWATYFDDYGQNAQNGAHDRLHIPIRP